MWTSDEFEMGGRPAGPGAHGPAHHRHHHPAHVHRGGPGHPGRGHGGPGGHGGEDPRGGGFDGGPFGRGGPFGAGGPFGPGGMFDGPGGPRGPRGGSRRRARRGDVRLGALHLLAEEPRNGYGIIRELADRSGGSWTPSSGAVYPALQQLEDEGLIEPAPEAGPKHFRLTEAGRAEVERVADQPRPWERASREAAGDMGGDPELWTAFGQVALAVRAVVESGEPKLAAKATEELSGLRRRLYGLLAEGPDTSAS